MEKKSPGIGQLNEGQLHQSIKRWYHEPGDQMEVACDGYVIDLVRGDRLLEIQTRNFGAMKKKLKKLVKKYPVHLIHPIAKEKIIIRKDADEEMVLSRRKSPKKGNIYHLFDELIRIPTMINHPNFSLEILLIQEEEIRCEDGTGSWRRKGQRIVSHDLLDVYEQRTFHHAEDFLNLLPDTLDQPFSSKSLAKEAGIKVHLARKVLYCLRHMEAIEIDCKQGNLLCYKVMENKEDI